MDPAFVWYEAAGITFRKIETTGAPVETVGVLNKLANPGCPVAFRYRQIGTN